MYYCWTSRVVHVTLKGPSVVKELVIATILGCATGGLWKMHHWNEQRRTRAFYNYLPNCLSAHPNYLLKKPIENSLRDAKLSFKDIDEEPNVTVNPDEVVALRFVVQFKPDPRFEEAKEFIRSGAFGRYDYNPLLDSLEGNSGYGRGDYFLVGYDFPATSTPRQKWTKLTRATSFLFTEYQYVGIFMVAFAILIFLFLGSMEGFNTKSQTCTYDTTKLCKPALATAVFSIISFVLGAVTSVISGFLGMKIATYANARTTLEARKGVEKAFIVAFRSGAVMGFLLAANGLLVLYIAINLFKDILW